MSVPISTGWCTYYTCLKRLSTFFTIVAMGTDYHIWMTGSNPSSLRFHVLNSSPEEAIRLYIWYKNPQRKDVYKVYTVHYFFSYVILITVFWLKSTVLHTLFLTDLPLALILSLSFFSFSLSLSHTHTHTHTLSLIHTHTHTHTLSFSLSHTHTHTHTLTLSLHRMVCI